VSATAYPLTWPPMFPRAKNREKGAFKTTLSNAMKNVDDSLRKFAADSGKRLSDVVISSNVSLGVSRPADSGVAVWFTWDGLGVCIAVDRYLNIESNLQAIHHIIEARRVELRHGTLALVRATAQGFVALPAPAARSWHQVLLVAPDASPEMIRAGYRNLRSTFHPDKPGGNAERFDEVQKAYDQATAEGRA
jgi:hypothetical protein